MRNILIATALIAIAAPGAASDRNKIPVATPTGEAVSCIPLSSIRESRVRSDTVIDFVANGKKVYRNTLPNSCPGLGFEEKFMYKTSLSQLCSTDIITVLNSSGGLSRGASCGLGQFQPVTLSK